MERRHMLWMDLSRLRLTELRSLLANARRRGQDALAEQIEAEIAGRAKGSVAGPPIAREPPVEPDDDVLPMAFESAHDEFALALPTGRRKPARRWPIVAAGMLATAGAALAWALSGAPGLPGDEPPPTPPRAAAVTVPQPAPRAMAARIDGPAPTPASAEPSAPAMAQPEPSRPTRLDPCATPPTPADRLLCGDLALSLLDHEMRGALDRAMAAADDPDALREGQASWRRVRDPIGDPRALAEAYDRRIRELNAAAAAAPP